MDVDEVTRLGPGVEHEDLVGAELLLRQHGAERRGDRRPEPVVPGEIDGGGGQPVPDAETYEALDHLFARHRHAGGTERGLELRAKVAHLPGRTGEAVEIVRTPVHDAEDDQCAAARQREALSFRQVCDDFEDPLLDRGQHE